MKSFTVTFHHSNNYGALLQTYALQQTITRLGIENTVFEYPYRNSFYEKVDFRRPREAAASLYSNFKKILHKDEIKRRKKSFQDFHINRLKLSQTFYSMDELRASEIDADVFITGSDQVWRFSGNQEFLPARFLDFGSESAKRVSYAASIERLNYTDEQKKLAKKWIEPFSAVSLREESARAYISEITGKKAERVLDPVFLFEPKDWDEIAAEPRFKDPYILCYQVQSNSEMQRTVNALKRKTGFKTVAILPASKKYIKTDETLFDVSPEEFIGLYQNAAVVVSGSFHGTALGYLFGKPTYAAVRSSGSDRIRDLASLLGQTRFCIGAGDGIPEISEFDGVQLKNRIAEEREKSMAFLKNALTN